jgi:hypothetical protein
VILPLAGAVAGATLRVPVDIDRDEARAAARRELADPAYRAAEPSLLQRALSWVFDQVLNLLDAITATVPGGVGGLIVLALLAMVIAVVVRWRVGGVARGARRREHAVFSERPRTAAGHRRAAAEALARGALDEAVRERFRAVVRDLEQRGLLDERPGRTADEAAADAGVHLRAAAPGLREAARIFDDVWYGGRAASRAAYDRIAAVDAQVQAERPVPVGARR